MTGKGVQKELLVDIKDVKMDTPLSHTERLREFVKQVGKLFIARGFLMQINSHSKPLRIS